MGNRIIFIIVGVVVVVVGDLLGFPIGIIDFILNIGSNLLTNSFTSFISGKFIEALTGNVLKTIVISVFGGITLFSIAKFLLKSGFGSQGIY